MLYSLGKHFDKVLPMLAEMLETPTFPQKELDTFIQVNQQNLQIDLSKNDTLAYRAVTELIFGKDHPYGYNSFPETYGLLERADLLRHYDRCFTAGNCKIVISGKITDEVLTSLNRHLSAAIRPGAALKWRYEWEGNCLIAMIPITRAGICSIRCLAATSARA